MAQNLLVQFGISALGLLFVLVGLHTANRGRKRWVRSERIAGTETTRIRDLEPGTVEVKGSVRPADGVDSFESPLSRTEAFASHVEVEEWESSGQGGGDWETIYESTAAVPFTVDDGTGEVRVDLPTAAGLDVEHDRTTVGSGDEPPAAVQRFLDAESSVDEGTRHTLGPLRFGDRRRYSEGVIEPGESVYVLGNVRKEPGDWGERNFVIDEPTTEGEFVLSDKSEESLVWEGRRGGFLYLAFGAVLAFVGAGVAVIAWAGV